MKIVGATEYALVFYRDKLPKFNNNGKMIKNWFEWKPDPKSVYPKVHPTQKPVNLLKTLIKIFTDPGDTVIDPVAGSGSTLRAARELNRNSYGFEVEKEFYRKATMEMLREDELKQLNLFQEEFMDGFYLTTVSELKKVAEEVIKEKYNLKNDLVMTGWAIKINDIINRIQDIKLKEKLEKECEEIWNKWYEKVQKQLTKDNLAILDSLIGGKI